MLLLLNTDIERVLTMRDCLASLGRAVTSVGPTERDAGSGARQVARILALLQDGPCDLAVRTEPATRR
jgi:hypothetical protein